MSIKRAGQFSDLPDTVLIGVKQHRFRSVRPNIRSPTQILAPSLTDCHDSTFRKTHIPATRLGSVDLLAFLASPITDGLDKKLSYRRDSARCGCTSPQPNLSAVYNLYYTSIKFAYAY